MKSASTKLLLIISLFGVVQVVARELRAPLPFRNGFHRFEHYPLICEDWDTCWDYDVWGGAYHRQADLAFTNDHGTKKQSLAGLYFGKDDFCGQGFFSPETDFSRFPSLTWSQIAPRFDYSENGAMFGFNVNRTFCCGKWDVGVRTNIPFRSVKVELDCCEFVEQLSDVCVVKDERALTEDSVVQTIQNSYAYRLDFVAALRKTVNEINGNPERLLKFRDPTSVPPNSIIISEHVLNRVVANTDNVTADSYPVHVVAVEGGKVPVPPCVKRLFVGTPEDASTADPAANRQDLGVTNLPVLPNDGTLTIGDRAKFGNPQGAPDGDSSDYTALGNSKTNQRKLWIIPTALTQNNVFQLSGNSNDIRNQIQNLIIADDSPNTVFEQNGISFDTQRLTGVGDLDVDFYFRRNWCDECRGDYYVEGIVGVRFPTGKKVKDPGKVLAQPLGNNRHFEVKLGAQTGWQPKCWFAVKADLSYSHVFKRTEKVAAAFTGATVKNIGPTVDAKVSWDYLIGNLDLTFVHPCSDACIGFDIGYQPYVKFKDKVSFKGKTATDLLGNVNQTLDDDVLEKYTKQVVHRIKTEFFHKNCTWEVFAGWLHSVAGKNIQRETDWYVGFGIFF